MTRLSVCHSSCGLGCNSDPAFLSSDKTFKHEGLSSPKPAHFNWNN